LPSKLTKKGNSLATIPDTIVTMELLYQLSYNGTFFAKATKRLIY